MNLLYGIWIKIKSPFGYKLPHLRFLDHSYKGIQLTLSTQRCKGTALTDEKGQYGGRERPEETEWKGGRYRRGLEWRIGRRRKSYPIPVYEASRRLFASFDVRTSTYHICGRAMLLAFLSNVKQMCCLQKKLLTKQKKKRGTIGASVINITNIRIKINYIKRR